jgi:transposase-like protein
MAITGTTVDWVKIDQHLREMDETVQKMARLAEIEEQNRIGQMQCPVCKSQKKTYNNLSNNNGVFGPGYYSHTILEFYVCDDCGVHYSDLNKKKG